MTTIDVTQSPYNADNTGVIDATSAIAAAEAACAYGDKLYFPAGIYKVSSTLAFAQGRKILGEDMMTTTIFRDTDYGDTFTFGDDTNSSGVPLNPARDWGVEEITLRHGAFFSNGDTSISNKATTGCHIRAKGSQYSYLKRVRFVRMPEQVVYHGGSSITHTDVTFLSGPWDHTDNNLQEAVCMLRFDVSTIHGNPTTFTSIGTKYYGAKTNSRVHNIIRNQPVYGTYNSVENIGAKRAIIIHGLEDADFINDRFGGMNEYAISYENKFGGGIVNHRWTGTYFDGCGLGHLYMKAVTNTFSENIKFADCDWDGGLTTQNCIFVDQTQLTNGTWSVINLQVIGGMMKSTFGSPILLLGSKNGRFESYTVKNYNCWNVQHNDLKNNAQWVSAGNILTTFGSGNVFNAITMGGDMSGQTSSTAPTGYNFCKQGFVQVTGANSLQGNLVNRGIISGTVANF